MTLFSRQSAYIYMEAYVRTKTKLLSASQNPPNKNKVTDRIIILHLKQSFGVLDRSSK